MIVLESKDYERIAHEVVEQYHTSGTPLNDTICKVASDMGLNPEQIKQVVWTSNTKLHLDLFNKEASVGGDKYVEFPVADPDYVLRRIYAPEDEQPLPVPGEKIAMDFFSPLPVESEKVAAEEYVPEEVVPSATTLSHRKGKDIIHLCKVAHELEQEVMAGQFLYEEKLEELASSLRKLAYTSPTTHADMEKDAYTLHGDAILPVLRDVRLAVRKEGDVEVQKLAYATDVLIEESPVLNAVKELKEVHASTVKYASALKSLKQKAKDVL